MFGTTMEFDAPRGLYTFRGMFGVNFRGFIRNTVLGDKKANLLFRELSFKEIVIDSFFLLELREILERITTGEYGFTSWVNVKALQELLDIIQTKTWISPNNSLEGEVRFVLNRERINKVFATPPRDFQEIFYDTYERVKNDLEYKGLLTDAATGTGKTYMGLSIAEGCDADIVLIIAMNANLETTWLKTIVEDEDGFYREKNKREDVYTASDYYSGKPYNGQKFILFNYEAIDKLNTFIGKYSRSNIVLVVDEVHNFTSLSSSRRENLLSLVNISKTKNAILLSGTPIKASALEIIPYLEIIDPKFNKTVEARFKKLYSSPNYILKQCIPIRYGQISVKIEKAVLELKPIEFKTIEIKLANGEEYTLKSIKEKMVAYIDKRSKELADNLDLYINTYNVLVDKARKSSALPVSAWIEYENNFKLVGEYYEKRQLMFHTDVIKATNDFEKTIILPVLKGEEKDKFKEASVILKYPMLKIRGETLGRIVLGARIECHNDMASHFDYSILNSTMAKSIVMTSYVKIAETVIDRCKKQGFNPVGVFGDNTKLATKLINSFIDDKDVDPLVGTFKSISTGHHLVVANLVLLMDLPFRTYLLDQALARVHRMGQKEDVIAIYTKLDTGEEYNINSRNIDILKWAKNAIEEITGNAIKGLDFDKGLVLDVIEGMESMNKTLFVKMENEVYEMIAVDEGHKSLAKISIVPNKFKRKLLNW